MNSEKNMDERRSVVRALGASLRWTRMAFSVVVALAAMTQANAATIGEAVDATNLVWTTGGDANWFSQSIETQDGIDAAQSGVIGDSQSTWIQTTVTGPGTVSFWWRVSSEEVSDYLKFYVDGTQLVSVVGITGDQGWIMETASISNGVHTFRWEYSKDHLTSLGSDCGWVDQVVWTPVNYTVSATASPVFAGSTTGSGNYFSGTNCTVTAVANTGYSFTNWTEGTTVLTSSTNYTDSVLSNRMLVANFTTNSYMITTSPNPAGGGTITGDGSYPYHSSCILIATPKPNYTFANWTEGASIVSTSPNYGFQVDGPRTLVANFTPDNFEIVTSSNPMGGGTTSGGGTHAYDSSCTLIAVPAVGYIFTAWTEGPSTVSTSTNYTFTVSGDRTLVANFTKISYTITTSSNPVGGGTIAGAEPYEYGASCTVIATPSSSWYTFVNWTEGTNEVSSTTNYMFTVESNRTLVANFVYTRTIGHAVDAPELIWSTGGDAGYPVAGTTNWFAQTATTHDGVDAAQSGTISDGGTSWMQTTVIGPGSLSFWWKVDTLDTGDKLKFFVDSIEQPGTIGGPMNWTQNTYSIPAGVHTLRWAYVKNFNGSFAPDCGWVDQVVWTGDPATNLMPIHRFWSDQFGAHFYIMGDSERDRIEAKYPGIWNYEAVAWYAYLVQVAGTEPVHRFWSDQLGKHFYIMGDSERDRIAAKYPGIWRYEAVAWYAFPTQVTGSEPVGRFWSDQFMGHFYIITQSEITRIANKYPGIWNYETVAYYAFTSASGDARSAARNTFSVPPKAENGRVATFPEMRSMSFSPKSSSAVSDYGDIVFPLSYPGRNIAAHVYDSFLDQWTCVLESTNSPSSVTFKGFVPDRSYLLEIVSGDPAGDPLTTRVHRSWFESRLEAPNPIHESGEASLSGTDDGVGSPVVRIQTPAVDGTITLKLYSSSQGVVEILTEVSGGETLELSLPEWNCWYWISGWSDTDNEPVLSLWFRHDAE